MAVSEKKHVGMKTVNFDEDCKVFLCTTRKDFTDPLGKVYLGKNCWEMFHDISIANQPSMCCGARKGVRGWKSSPGKLKSVAVAEPLVDVVPMIVWNAAAGLGRGLGSPIIEEAAVGSDAPDDDMGDMLDILSFKDARIKELEDTVAQLTLANEGLIGMNDTFSAALEQSAHKPAVPSPRSLSTKRGRARITVTPSKDHGDPASPVRRGNGGRRARPGLSIPFGPALHAVAHPTRMRSPQLEPKNLGLAFTELSDLESSDSD